MDVLYGLHPTWRRPSARASRQARICRRRRQGTLWRQGAGGRSRQPGSSSSAEVCRHPGLHRAEASSLRVIAQTDAHQGVLAVRCRERKFLTVEDLHSGDTRAGTRKFRFLVALDGIEDPHNLGAHPPFSLTMPWASMVCCCRNAGRRRSTATGRQDLRRRLRARSDRDV